MYLKEIENIPGVLVTTNRELKKITTFGIGGAAEILAEPQTLEGLSKLVQIIHQKQIPCHILGGGSNVLFGDGLIKGVVIRLSRFRRFEVPSHHIVVGAGLSTPAMIKRAAALGLSGWEPLVGIPGTLGGAMAMNAGGKYGEITDTLQWIKWMDWEGGIHFQKKSQIPFSYRRSNLPGIAIEGLFTLTPSDAERVENRCREILEEKKSSQPLGERSAGCVFKNPPGHSAGRLIDQCGLKGFSVGGATVSEIHGNFILNRREATCEEVLELVKIIQQRVLEATGVTLEMEVKLMGVAKEAEKAKKRVA